MCWAPRDPPATPSWSTRNMYKEENGSFHYYNITFDTYFLCDNATDIIYEKLTNNNRKYRNIMYKNVDF